MRFVTRRADQLDLPLRAAPRTGEQLLALLTRLGLTGIARCRLTRNRTVMVSFRAGELRVHEGYLAAPPAVLEAIVTFVCGRSAAARRSARAAILGFPVERPARVRRPERTRPEDQGWADRLTDWHARYNERLFDGALRPLAVRVSRRMRSRLGHYMASSPAGDAPEIVISRRHIRRHGWTEALHTLLHEMVHQWQDEAGHAIDHGRTFRAKAREVGITPSARRTVGPATTHPEREQALALKAAREG
jgi:SprT-like family protein